MLWPDGELTLTIGRLLPASMLENEYVRDLVFPGFSEVQDPVGRGGTVRAPVGAVPLHERLGRRARRS